MPGRPAQAPGLFWAASPRPGGNSELAIKLFYETFSETLAEQQSASAEINYPITVDAGLHSPWRWNPSGRSPRSIAKEITFLRNLSLVPCRACGRCSSRPDLPCPLDFEPPAGPDAPDDAARLLAGLADAPFVVLASPIYFYHLPAGLKALIDRGQIYWMRGQKAVPGRKAHVILTAAREKGEKLFSGSLLTLKIFFAAFGLSLAEPLLLRGLDGPADLRGNPGLTGQVRDYARAAALERLCSKPD